MPCTKMKKKPSVNRNLPVQGEIHKLRPRENSHAQGRKIGQGPLCLNKDFRSEKNNSLDSSSSSGARSGTDIGDHASPNISVIRQLQKI